jgi:hypothetical protein
MSTAEPTTLDAARMTRAQRAALPLSADVVQALAEQHGVCVRPLAMRRIDTTGRVEVVPLRVDPPVPTSARRVRRRPAGCGWLNAAKAGTSTPNPPPTGPHPLTRISTLLVRLNHRCCVQDGGWAVTAAELGV